MVQSAKGQATVEGEGDEQLISCPGRANRHTQTLIGSGSTQDGSAIHPSVPSIGVGNP